MKLTIVQAGDVPAALEDRFTHYPAMFETMFTQTSQGFSYQTVRGNSGQPLPDASALEAIVITGSSAGVYDDFAWIEPMRAFIRTAYGAGIPMVGICFGHQIIADALGGDVRKSEKGWGLGRHIYTGKAQANTPFSTGQLAIACSHQDQVIVAPKEAEIILASDFTPNAGLRYKNGATISFQPHPEFSDEYSKELVELRVEKADAKTIAKARTSFETKSDSTKLAGYIAGFLKNAAR